MYIISYIIYIISYHIYIYINIYIFVYIIQSYTQYTYMYYVYIISYAPSHPRIDCANLTDVFHVLSEYSTVPHRLVVGNTSTGVVKYYPFHRNDDPTVFINLQPLGLVSKSVCCSVQSQLKKSRLCFFHVRLLQSGTDDVLAVLTAPESLLKARQVPELHEIKRGDGNGITLGAACTLSTLIEDCKTHKTPPDTSC